MTLLELKESVDNAVACEFRDPAEVVVCIPIKKAWPSIGKSHVMPVTNFAMGFDWDAGRAFIIPEHNLTESVL